jgi:transcriptional regulator of acetoin/glycerol metabolism
VSETLPLDEAARDRPARADHLYLALAGGKPGGGARWSLADVDAVEIGRGAERASRRDGRALRIDVPDRWLSTVHLRLERPAAHWFAVDAGSRNGILVDGAKTARAVLGDRSIVEAGRSFFAVRVGEVAGDPALVLPARGAPGELVTLDPQLARAFDELARVAPTLVPVVISGATGTGKERVARALHTASRRGGAFVAVNCGALPAGLVESELFGHKRGAFSGAIADAPGLVVAAQGGTLLLDEIGDLPAPAQAALLRVLEAREVRAVGATQPIAVDVRVVAATHRDLDAMIEAGTFREDLYARLAGFTIELPTLAERAVDLGAIVSELAPNATLAAAAARALFAYGWPRNIRELARALERAVALAGDGEIAVDHLPPELAAARFERAAPADDPRRGELETLLAKHRGNVTKVAEEMGRLRQQIQRWVKRYGIDPERYR